MWCLVDLEWVGFEKCCWVGCEWWVVFVIVGVVGFGVVVVCWCGMWIVGGVGGVVGLREEVGYGGGVGEEGV